MVTLHPSLAYQASALTSKLRSGLRLRESNSHQWHQKPLCYRYTKSQYGLSPSCCPKNLGTRILCDTSFTRDKFGSGTGTRTPIYTLKGCRPNLLDDAATWSAMSDLNTQPRAPKARALPSCANSRYIQLCLTLPILQVRFLLITSIRQSNCYEEVYYFINRTFIRTELLIRKPGVAHYVRGYPGIVNFGGPTHKLQ